jgi:hypothetical protein
MTVIGLPWSVCPAVSSMYKAFHNIVAGAMLLPGSPRGGFLQYNQGGLNDCPMYARRHSRAAAQFGGISHGLYLQRRCEDD